MSETTLSTQEYIELWKVIYRGYPDWLNYQYATLAGRLQKRTRKSFKGAKMVCTELIGLMYSERPTMKASSDLQAILDRSGWDRNISGFSEKTLALGGGAFKIFTKDNLIYIDFVSAGDFFPVSWDQNGIYEADFLERKIFNKKKYLRIEKHRKIEGGYNILNEYYELGQGGQRNKTTAYACGLTVDPEVQANGVNIMTENPLFSYVYLPEANNIEDDVRTGISVFANSVDTLEGLDIAFDALRSEVVLGRKRIIVPAQAVRRVVNDEGVLVKYFDPSDEVYQAFEGDDTTALKITDNTTELRIDDLRMAVQTYLDILSIQIGFSAGYLTFDGQSGMKTATEIVSENSKTHKTSVNLSEAFKDAIESIVESIRAIEPIYNISVGEFSYTYQDNIIEDRATKTAYWTNRLNQGTATLEEMLMNVDGLDEAGAIKQANIIRVANATGTIDNTFEVE